jgi:Zn-dependent peptidase ImmA (M78 family)/transcriptional regulator with XRE-family HTH domain
VIGERVRLAREACLLTQEQLGEGIGLTQVAVHDIEAGRSSPSDKTLAAISRVTGFPIRFFGLGPLPDFPEGRFRRLKKGTKKVSRQVRAQVRHFFEVVQRAERDLALPAVALRPVGHDDAYTPSEVEEIADDVRAALNLGARDPIPNLTRALERGGVIVVMLPTEMVDHDGFSAWPYFGVDEGRPIIALGRGNPGDRNRFTVAHEAGHLVLHTLRPDLDPDLAEAEANRFAGALLLPEPAAREALRVPVTLSVLRNVKGTWGCSIGMGAQRAKDLGLISPEHFVSLRKQISARGWTKSEPGEFDPEEPQLIGKVVSHLGGGGSLLERADRVPIGLFALRAVLAS